MYYIKFFDGDTDASNIDIMSIDDFTQYLMSEFLDIEAVDAAIGALFDNDFDYAANILSRFNIEVRSVYKIDNIKTVFYHVQDCNI